MRMPEALHWRRGRLGATALIIIDPQNDFCAPGGVVFALSERKLMIQKAARKIQVLLEEVRQHQIPCIVVRSFFDEKYKLPSMQAKHRQLGIRQNVCIENSWGAKIEAIKTTALECYVTKHTVDAFLYTPLEALLRKYQIHNILICGFLTEICVLETVRSALQRGFFVTLPLECTAGLSELCERHAIEEMRALQAEIVDLEELIEEWKKCKLKKTKLTDSLLKTTPEQQTITSWLSRVR